VPVAATRADASVLGPVLAAGAGLGFGVFQALNRRAVQGIPDAALATFLQLVIAVVVLLAATVATEDLAVLSSATTAAIVFFVLAGLIHFSFGWTLLNTSQMRIGAARTSPLLSTNPVLGAIVAAVTLRELPQLLAWVGIALVTLGALVVSVPGAVDAGADLRWQDSVYGLGTSLCWAISPIFVREGLDGLPSPLIGVTLGMVVAVAAYGLVLPFRERRGGRIATGALSFKLAAGVFVALSTWARWVALDSTSIGVVLALGLLSVPVVLVLSPLLMVRHVERVTLAVWSGAALVVGGALVLVVTG
jgi:drug/metabolite transporter (DMT)-like permease